MLKPGILTLDTNNHAVRGKSGVKTSEFSEKKLIYPPPPVSSLPIYLLPKYLPHIFPSLWWKKFQLSLERVS